MNRREAVRRVALMMGGTFFVPDFADALNNLIPSNVDFTWTKAQEVLIAEIADTIIPTTNTPGAKAAGVDKFVLKMMADCYEKEVSAKFMVDILKTDTDAQTTFKKAFAECNTAERTQLLKVVESEFSEARKQKSKDLNYWGIMKELTMLGYFTSEIGCTQALRYEQIPSRYDGNMPYKKGDKAFAGY
ncbi:MAG: hypothetical protein RIS64_4106 [Bacteroidota bacterium]|jgi:hypothetical protein